MKKIYCIIGCLLLNISIVSAQTEGITYQAVLVDNNPDEIPGIDVPSNNLPNKELSVQFTILDEFGTIEYQETQDTTTDDYGTINLTIGNGQTTGESLGGFNEINWDGPKVLNVAIDLSAGSNYEPFSSQSLTYVPYVRHRNLIADGFTDLNGDFSVNNESLATFTGDVDINQTLDVESFANFKDRVTIDATMASTDQSDINAYPFLVSGSSHGMAIKLNENIPGRKDNFMSFWNNQDEPIGRIEGFQPNQALLDFASISSILFDFEPTEDDEPQEPEDGEEPEEEEIDRNDYPTDFPDALDTYFNNDYTLDYLMYSMDIVLATFDFFWDAACYITWVPGVDADIDDCVTAIFDVFIQGTQLALYLGYNEYNKGVAFESGGADYAEWLMKYDANEILHFGDIVGVRAGVISKRFITADHYMVVSKNPIVSGAMPKEDEMDNFKQIAFLGQVPVKVIGEVNKGDYILPSGNGDGMAIAVAPGKMKVNDYNRIIGVSWSEYHGNELFSYINTAVGINSNDLTQQVTAMQAVMNQMQTVLSQLSPNYEPSYFDAPNVSISHGNQMTTSQPLSEVIMEQYGINEATNSKEALLKINDLMESHDANSKWFKFSDLPYLNEVMTNPSQENIERARQAYSKAQKNIELITQRLN
ncbi:hypothetical protein GCM10011414_14130 [Croceivirga lutea]|uniref:hypothetical protein n=1 Tax=Croceivirga lutea TaxID=1775167 RepID=UPI00163B3F0F|nr:hypothetical protein [Croceivirga lutea]GGG45715.1 hypothetical protein GCM10011414_14130 [Croceivirga lutea]